LDAHVPQVLLQPRSGGAVRLLGAFLVLEEADGAGSFRKLQHVVRLEPADSADDLPNLVFVFDEGVASSELPA
jgi:hypothetical protein